MINSTLTKLILGMIGALLLSTTLSAKTILAINSEQTKRYFTHEADCGWIPAGGVCKMEWIVPNNVLSNSDETLSVAHCTIVKQFKSGGYNKKANIPARIVDKITNFPVLQRKVICRNNTSSRLYIKARAITITTDNNVTLELNKYEDGEVVKTSIKKTGQIASYNGQRDDGNDQRDDGFYQIGTSPSYTRNDEIVTHNSTGLMWQDDIDVASVTKPWVAKTNWDAREYFNTAGDTATTYCEELSLGSFDDWRLPTRKELQGIVNYGNYAPAINVAFMHTASKPSESESSESELYWSSTTLANTNSSPNVISGDFAWVVGFKSGYQGYNLKNGNYYVRCVRTGE